MRGLGLSGGLVAHAKPVQMYTRKNLRWFLAQDVGSKPRLTIIGHMEDIRKKENHTIMACHGVITLLGESR